MVEATPQRKQFAPQPLPESPRTVSGGNADLKRAQAGLGGRSRLDMSSLLLTKGPKDDDPQGRKGIEELRRERLDDDLLRRIERDEREDRRDIGRITREDYDGPDPDED